MNFKKYVGKLINTAIKPLGVRAVFTGNRPKRRRLPDWVTEADGTKMSHSAVVSYVRRIRESDLDDSPLARHNADRVISEWAFRNGAILDHAIWSVGATLEIARSDRYKLLSELQDKVGVTIVEDCEMSPHEVPKMMNFRLFLETPASKMNLALYEINRFALVDSNGKTTSRVEARFLRLVP